MAIRFEALEDLFDDALELPVGGKTYRVPSPSAEDGLRVQTITTLAARLLSGGEAIDTEALDDDEERDLFQLSLGPVYDELLTDGVSWSALRHVGLTAMFWITNGVETAQTYWKAAGDPSLLAPNREARRKAKKTGSAAASKTPRRGSTSGTSAPRATAKSRKAAKT